MLGVGRCLLLTACLQNLWTAVSEITNGDQNRRHRLWGLFVDLGERVGTYHARTRRPIQSSRDTRVPKTTCVSLVPTGTSG